jgi:hypothetical protein
MDNKKESPANAVPSTAGKKRSSAVLEEVLVARNERNELLKQQHEFIRANSTLNTKGKKQQVYKDELKIYGDIREGFSRERRTMRALKAKPGYDSDGSETMDTKQAIEQCKLTAEHALLGLKNRSEEDATVQPTP